MIRNILRKIIQQLLSMRYMKKKQKYVQPTFQNTTQTTIKNYSFNNFEWRKMTLSCSKKIFSIIKRDNYET